MFILIETLKFVLSFLVMVRIDSWLEWVMHQESMHTRRTFKWKWFERFMGRFFTAHAEQHHGSYKPGSSFIHADEPYGGLVMSKILLLAIIPVPLYAVFGYVFGWSVFWGLFLGGGGYVLIYEYLHWRIHTPFKEEPTGILALVLDFYTDAFLRHYHHHSRFNQNMNVFMPIEDKRKGTLVRMKRLPKPEPGLTPWLAARIGPQPK